MSNYTEQLRALAEQVARQKHLNACLAEQTARRVELERRVRELEAVCRVEQLDVDQLEGRSLAAFFWAVVGKKDERLTKEREEAYDAAVRHDAAAAELAALDADIARSAAELRALRGCETRYARLWDEKQAAVKAGGTPEAEQILLLEAQIAQADAQLAEIDEALSAGRAAKATTDRMLEHLDSAAGYGTWDMLGGGLLADLAKHSELDDAQRLVEQLQVQLGRFKAELADVEVSADLQISIDGFLRFADYFFDGLFADWAVMDEIDAAKGRVRDTQNQIERLLSRLSETRRKAEGQRGAADAQRRALVDGAEM